MPDAVWDNENTGRPSSDFYENGKKQGTDCEDIEGYAGSKMILE